MFSIRRAAKIVSKYLVFANGCIMYMLAALTYRFLDLEANKFGSTVDDFRVRNVNVGMQKSVILGCKINDFGV